MLEYQVVESTLAKIRYVKLSESFFKALKELEEGELEHYVSYMKIRTSSQWFWNRTFLLYLVLP